MLNVEQRLKRSKARGPQVHDAEPKRKFLAFTLSLEEYCIDLSMVQDILDFDAVATLPNTPDYIKGILLYRNQVIPAIDMRVLFNLGAPACDAYTPIIVIQCEGQYAALIVDCVLDEMEIDSSHIRQIFSPGSADFDFMVASSVVAQRKVVILDPKKLVAMPGIVDHIPANSYH